MLKPRSLILLTLSLVGLAMATLVLAGYWQQSVVRDLALQAQLERALSSQRLVEQQQRERLVQRADLVASNQAFVSYVSQALDPSPLPGMGADVGSLTDILVERRDQSGLEHLAVLNLDGRVVAATDPSMLRRRDLGSDPIVREAMQSLKPSSGPFLDAGLLRFIAIKPLLAGSTAEGFLFAGLRLDDSYARGLGEASGLDVLLLAGGESQSTLLASSLDPQRAAQIADTIGGSRSGDQSVLQAKGISIPRQIAPGGKATSAYRSSLFGAGNSTLQLAFLLPDQSPQHQTAIWRPLLLPLALIPLLGILVALLSWRRLLRPIALLPELLAAAAGGDVHRVMPVEGGGLSRLIALRFNQLMAALQERFASAEPPSQPPPALGGEDQT